MKVVSWPRLRLAPGPAAKSKLLVPVAEAQALAEVAEDDDMMADVLKVATPPLAHQRA